MTVTLKEHEIRPADTAAEQKRRYEADVARLLERRAEFVEVACPACMSSARKPRFEKYTLNYSECTECGTVYISPRPPPSVLREYYATSENYAYWNDVIFPASETVRRERIFRPRVSQLLDLCRSNRVSFGTLLEVGAGFGTFCEELRATAAFQRILAVEPTPDLASRCRSRGLEVIESPIETVVLDAPVDVVASFEVIEHLFDPAEFVRSCKSMLCPGGLIILTCPNVRGFDIMTLGAGSPAIDVEHLNYFHPVSLGRLLSANGFEVLDARTPGRLDADIVRNRVLAGEFDLAEPFLRTVLIDEWDRLGEPFQAFLAGHGLSSNMWIVARNA